MTYYTKLKLLFLSFIQLFLTALFGFLALQRYEMKNSMTIYMLLSVTDLFEENPVVQSYYREVLYISKETITVLITTKTPITKVYLWNRKRKKVIFLKSLKVRYYFLSGIKLLITISGNTFSTNRCKPVLEILIQIQLYRNTIYYCPSPQSLALFLVTTGLLCPSPPHSLLPRPNHFTYHFSKPMSISFSLFQYCFHSELVTCSKSCTSEILLSDSKFLHSTSLTCSFLLNLLLALRNTSSPLIISISRNPFTPAFLPQAQTQVSHSKNALLATWTSSPTCLLYQVTSG